MPPPPQDIYNRWPKKNKPKFANEKRPTMLAHELTEKPYFKIYHKKTANQFGWPANFFGWLIIFVSSFFNDEKIYMYRTVLSLLKHFSGESYFSIKFSPLELRISKKKKSHGQRSRWPNPIF